MQKIKIVNNIAPFTKKLIWFLYTNHETIIIICDYDSVLDAVIV